jgi:hypothetical protein
MKKERLRVYSRPFHLEKIFSGRFTIKENQRSVRLAVAAKKKTALCALQVTPCSHFCHFIYAACVYPRVPYLGQAEMNLPYASSLDGKNYLVSHTFLEEGKWCSSWRPPYSVHLSPASLASGVIVQMFIPVQTDGYGLEAN